MTEKTTYYALLLDGDTQESPSGLARRRTTDTGEFGDESFKKDGSWEYTSVIAGAKRGDMTFELVEISEEEANRIVERFRERWGAQE